MFKLSFVFASQDKYVIVMCTVLTQAEEILNYLLGIINPLKVDESEASRATCALIVHHVDPRQRPVAAEHLPQVPLCGVQAQAKHPQA